MLGGFFVASGVLAALMALPELWWPTTLAAAVQATAGITIAVTGSLIYAARTDGAPGPEKSAVAVRREAPLLGDWKAVRIGVLLVLGVWAFWYIRVNQADQWLAEDEAERQKAPAWKYSLNDFVGGIPAEKIRKRLSADGFRMRCYGNLDRQSKIEESDTLVCWTLANNIDGIPSQVIAFFFGPEGLRRIRIAFAPEQWPAAKDWFERFEGVAAGKFGVDTGGEDILGRRGTTGLLQISEGRRTPSVMALWHSRERLAETACQSGEFKSAQWRLLCQDWPAPAGPPGFLGGGSAVPVKSGTPARVAATLDSAFADIARCRFPGLFHAPWDGKSHIYFSERGLQPYKEGDGLYHFRVIDAAFGLQVREVIVPGTQDLHALAFDAPLVEAQKAIKSRFGSDFRPSASSRSGEAPELTATRDGKGSVLLCHEREGGE